MTMTFEDGDISALLSEPRLPEGQEAASEFNDALPSILESILSNENVVEPSPEEAAWADSCFVQTSELSDNDWGAMKKALLDALEKPMESSCDTSEVVHDQDTHVISESSHSLHDENVLRLVDVHMEQKDSSDDDNDTTEACNVANVIRGVDEHGKQIEGYAPQSEDGDELASSGVLEQTESRESIFKVWDLNAPFSDDEGELELIKDVQELLKENSQDAYPPPSDTSNALDQDSQDELVADLNDLSLQQLVADLSDLSLQQTFE